MLPTLRRVAGERLELIPKVTGAEDFSFFQRIIPGLFVFIGVTAAGIDPRAAPPNHSPRFHVDEAGLLLGIRTLAHLAWDFLESAGPRG